MLRFLLALPLVFAPAAARADEAADKAATVKYVLSLQDADTGAFRVTADGKPSLRACNGGVKVLRTLGVEVPMLDKLKAFTTRCYDAKAGCFAEPGERPNVAINAVGILVVMELGMDKTKFAGAMTYLKENAKAWEDVRIGGAAVEAWGVKDRPFPLDDWHEIAKKSTPNDALNNARARASLLAFELRLGLTPAPGFYNTADNVRLIRGNTKFGGGWGMDDARAGADIGDLETTYRVMRALHYAKVDTSKKTKEFQDVYEFVQRCRKPDGSYGLTGQKPQPASSLSAVYYAVMIENWLK